MRRKDSCRFCINRKGGTGGCGLTHRVLCTRRLLGLAVKWPWLAVDGPIIALVAQEYASLRTVGGSFLAIKMVWALNTSLLAEFNRAWLGLRVRLIWLQKYLDSVLESGLYQK